jgi:hypothetical protein
MMVKVPEDLFFLFRFEIFLFENLNVASKHLRCKFLFVLDRFSEQGSKLCKFGVWMLRLIQSAEILSRL